MGMFLGIFLGKHMGTQRSDKSPQVMQSRGGGADILCPTCWEQEGGKGQGGRRSRGSQGGAFTRPYSSCKQHIQAEPSVQCQVIWHKGLCVESVQTFIFATEQRARVSYNRHVNHTQNLPSKLRRLEQHPYEWG